MRRSAQRLVASCLVLVACPHADPLARAFEVSRVASRPPRQRSAGIAGFLSRRGTRPFSTTCLPMMMFQKQPGESESAFMKRIQQLASDPKAFERAVLHPNGDLAGGGRAAGTTTSLHHHSHHDGGNSTDASSAPPPRRGGYQRAEDWDRQEQERAKSANWEERVQFDGQRYGNRVQQNEVLRHHLKTF